ncbi:MAG: DNA polymerase III subunit gamma/tau [Anaerolineae bacterium]
MGQETLYLKWRPRDFDEVVGQTHVTRTLRNACRSGRIAHAYLFAGPRGTGKTSVARILAKAINCIAPAEQRPCNQCHVCAEVNQGRFLDLIEIDGASNRGIDEIRDLREKVTFRPNEGAYKVYIIDEVHMLTREAFNALLKTLEEPPSFVVFVFATTEVWRIPATIRSRCQRFDFRPIRLELLEARLRQISDADSIARDDRALSLIARQSTGSMRDAVSMLDQIASVGEGMVTAELVRSVLGTAPDEAAEQLLSMLLEGELAPALELLSQLSAEGFDMRQFGQDFLQLARAMLLVRLGVRPEADVPAETLARLNDLGQSLETEALLDLTRLMGQASEQVRHGQLPQLPLELALVQASARFQRQAAPQPAPELTRTARPPTSAPGTVRQAPSASQQQAPSQQPAFRQAPPERRSSAEMPPARSPAAEATLTLERLRKVWPKVTAKVRQRDRTLEALLRSTEPMALADGTATVAFTYPFHRACFEEDEGRRLLIQAIRDATGEEVKLSLAVVSPGSRTAAAAPSGAETAKDKPLAIEDDPLYRSAIDELGGRVTVVDSGGEGGE